MLTPIPYAAFCSFLQKEASIFLEDDVPFHTLEFGPDGPGGLPESVTLVLSMPISSRPGETRVLDTAYVFTPGTFNARLGKKDPNTVLALDVEENVIELVFYFQDNSVIKTMLGA